MNTGCFLKGYIKFSRFKSKKHSNQNINKIQKAKKLENRKCRLQCHKSRRYKKKKKGASCCKASNKTTS